MSAEISAKKQLYFLHRWTGLILATVGILVFFRGAFLVFHHSLSDWAQRGNYLRPMSEIDGFDLDQAYALVATDVSLEHKKNIFVRQNAGAPVSFLFRGVTGEGAELTEVQINPETMSIVSRDVRGLQDDNPISPEASYVRFFLNLHILLLMPRTLGLIATGIAGFALMVLIVSGFWVYKPTWRNLMTRPSGAPRRFIGHLHAWVGTWTLPFTIILAFTGTFFSFAGALVLPVVALVSAGGDVDELVRTVQGKIEVPPRRKSLP